MIKLITQVFQMENKVGLDVHRQIKMKRITSPLQDTCNLSQICWKQPGELLSKQNSSRKGVTFSKCIFTDKQNIRHLNKVMPLGKYINLRTISSDKARVNACPSKDLQLLQDSFEKNVQKYSINKNFKKNGQILDNRIKKRQIPSQLYTEINHVFKNIQILKGYGFSEKKITKWMNIFLVKKSQILRDLFLKSYMNKKSLNNSMIYQRWTVMDSVLSKMQKVVERMSESQTTFLISEIRSFKIYIQQIVVKKAQSNLDEIFNIESLNPILKFQKPSQFGTSAQVFHFIKDLKSIQDRYGQLGCVSNVNRLMFKQILQAEDRFIREFHSHRNQD